mmetsp:Transcript_6189/g.10345  ORF Transcript_6189/g.10345 Transcript_6189/m.10345 type:complete len:411 (-) Transcript_6189:147-1379(-)
MNWEEKLATGQLCIGIMSALGCSSIMLTYFLFPQLRQQRYTELVFYVAVNDLVASVGMALGPSKDSSAACWFQGLTTTYNYLSSIFWTTLIVYQVYCIVVSNQCVFKYMAGYHLLCWGLPLLLTFLPLTTNTYDNTDDQGTWCFVANDSRSPSWSELFWWVAAFYFWLWAALTYSVYSLTSVALKLRKLKRIPPVISQTVRKLVLYPIVTMLCWGPNIVVNTYAFIEGARFDFSSPIWRTAILIAIWCTTSQGFLNSCVFFTLNPLVRVQWCIFLSEMCDTITCQYEAGGDVNTSNARASAQSLQDEGTGGGGVGVSSFSTVGTTTTTATTRAEDRALCKVRLSTAIESEVDYIPRQSLVLRESVGANGGVAVDAMELERGSSQIDMTTTTTAAGHTANDGSVMNPVFRS